MAILETHPEGTPCWIDYNVSSTDEREKLMDFFSQLFDWTWEVGEEDHGFYSQALSNGQPVLGIGQGDGADGSQVTYFATSNIDAAVARCVQLGGTAVMGPMAIGDVGSMAYVIDPVGARHGLWQSGTFSGFGAAYEPGTPGWFDHQSADHVAASHYYSELTGHMTEDVGSGGLILRNGDQWFASLSPAPDGMPAAWSAIFVAGSMPSVREKARSLGATVLVEEQTVPGSVITVFLNPVTHQPVTVMQGGDS